ncbi:MAG: RNA polymerase sigma factor SigW, partial [Gorillibacterium sp.]|nr:RNA polymerase sigma factor SigW [Gorillibacterium sp.]
MSTGGMPLKDMEARLAKLARTGDRVAFAGLVDL